MKVIQKRWENGSKLMELNLLFLQSVSKFQSWPLFEAYIFSTLNPELTGTKMSEKLTRTHQGSTKIYQKRPKTHNFIK